MKTKILLWLLTFVWFLLGIWWWSANMCSTCKEASSQTSSTEIGETVPLQPVVAETGTSEMTQTDEALASEKELVFESREIFFDSDQQTFRITDEINRYIDDIVAYLKAHENQKVELIGHSDNTGNAENNVILSRNRAESLKERLIKYDIHADQIIVKGVGHTQPIASNDTEEGKSKNRRVSIQLIKQ